MPTRPFLLFLSSQIYFPDVLLVGSMILTRRGPAPVFKRERSIGSIVTHPVQASCIVAFFFVTILHANPLWFPRTPRIIQLESYLADGANICVKGIPVNFPYLKIVMKPVGRVQIYKSGIAMSSMQFYTNVTIRVGTFDQLRSYVDYVPCSISHLSDGQKHQSQNDLSLHHLEVVSRGLEV